MLPSPPPLRAVSNAPSTRLPALPSSERRLEKEAPLALSALSLRAKRAGAPVPLTALELMPWAALLLPLAVLRLAEFRVCS